MVGGVVVDNNLELFDIQTACSDGSRNNNRHNTALEVCDRLISVDLVLATMEGHASITAAQKIAEKIVRRLLSLNEDENTRVAIVVGLLPENLQQAIELGIFGSDLDDLRNLWGDNALATDGDLKGFVQYLACQRIHLLWECGREQHCLAVWSNVVHNFHNL